MYGENTGIYTVKVDGTSLERLNDGLLVHWSPDDNLLIAETDVNGMTNLNLIMQDRQSKQKLVSVCGKISNPSWSPDGKRVAFESNHEGNTRIYILNLADNTFELQRLIN